MPGDEPALDRHVWLGHRTMSTPLAPEISLAEQVASHIETMAREQTPGSRIGSKDELREIVGVSVGTLNEALRIAQARGTVTLRRGPGGGIFSAQTTTFMRLGAQIVGMENDSHTVRDALRMRNALDPLSIDDALENASAVDFEDLREIVRSMERALLEGDADGFIRGHWGFQARVTSVSPNPLLRTVFTGLIDLLNERSIALSPALGTDRAQLPVLLSLHTRMLDALESRDREAAFAVMADYIASQDAIDRS